jgi:redox-sensitive bicupin YhaK (pirin superfamily)
MLWDEDIPVVEIRDEQQQLSKVKVIAGSFNGKEAITPPKASWANDKAHQVGIMLIEMEPNASMTLPMRSGQINRNLYFYRGEKPIKIDGESIKPDSRVKLNPGEDVLINNGDAKSFMLLLEGEPILEPMAAYGPFVMNTEEEIRQSYDEYERTGFGGWPWKDEAPIHAEENRRFAKHINGEIEWR